MANIVIETDSYGLQEGEYFNDVVSIGGFPGQQKIKRIKNISLLYDSYIVQGMHVAYELTDGSVKIANHLGSGNPNVSIDFLDTEVLVGVSGKLGMPGTVLFKELPYLCSLRFFIADTAKGTLRILGPYAFYHDSGKPFMVAGHIIGFGGKLLINSVEPKNSITLSFIRSISVDSSAGLSSV